MPTTNPNQYTLLDENIQPILNKSNQPFGFTIGQETSLFAISSFVLFLFLAASGVATIGRILYALGLKTANSDNEAKITTANKIITSSLFALLMSFSLVLLFLAVNPDVVKGTVDFSKIAVKSNNSTPATNVQPINPVNGSSVTSGQNEEALRQSFKNAGISINNPACTITQTTSCTNVAGLPVETVNMLTSLRATCILSSSSCEVIITGGTEPGHVSHGVGLRPVDLRINSVSDPLYTFLKFNSTAFGEKRGSNGNLLCSQQYKWVGSNFMFCDEPENPTNPSGARHWHVS